VNDLHEPDETSHEEGCSGVEKKHSSKCIGKDRLKTIALSAFFILLY
jgi:hypothetical protein